MGYYSELVIQQQELSGLDTWLTQTPETDEPIDDDVIQSTCKVCNHDIFGIPNADYCDDCFISISMEKEE